MHKVIIFVFFQPIDSPTASKPLIKNNQHMGHLGGALHHPTMTTDINGHTVLSNRGGSAAIPPPPAGHHENSGGYSYDHVGYQRDSCWVMFFHCLRGNQQYRHFKSMQKTGQLSVSKIDMLSRIIFPSSFICLNILYWTGFILF